MWGGGRQAGGGADSGAGQLWEEDRSLHEDVLYQGRTGLGFGAKTHAAWTKLAEEDKRRPAASVHLAPTSCWTWG